MNVYFPKVSIIMPTYNRAAFIGETIESILAQSYTNWELIIVDDGSEDNTEAVILKFGDERIQFMKAGRIGIGGTIKNLGIRQSSGELLAFIDSDDLWAPSKIENQVKALEEFPEAGFSLTNGYNFRERNKPLDHFFKQKEGIELADIFLRLFRSEATIFTQALLLRKKCLDTSGLFKEMKSFSDADFIISLAQHFKAALIYEPLVFRRLHESNYIHSNWAKSYEEGKELIDTYKKQTLLPDTVARKALFRLHINYGEKYILYKQPLKAIAQFMMAWKNQPLSIAPLKKSVKAILHYFKSSPSSQKFP